MNNVSELVLASDELSGYLDVGFQHKGNRHWPDDIKAKIVEQTYQPGCSVPEIAQLYGVHKSSLYGWRQKHREGKLGVTNQPHDEPSFVPLVKDDTPSFDKVDALLDGVEIKVGKSIICLTQSLSISQLSNLVKHLNGDL